MAKSYLVETESKVHKTKNPDAIKAKGFDVDADGQYIRDHLVISGPAEVAQDAVPLMRKVLSVAKSLEKLDPVTFAVINRALRSTGNGLNAILLQYCEEHKLTIAGFNDKPAKAAKKRDVRDAKKVELDIDLAAAV